MIRTSAIMALLAGLFMCIHSAFAVTLPLENFVKHGDYLDMQLSPDGKRIAARVRADGKVFAIILDTETMQIVGGVRPGNNDIVHSLNWVNNERLVYEYAEKFSNFDAPTPTGELFAINYDGSKNKILYGYRAGDAQTGSRLSSREDAYATQEVISYITGDDKHILIIEYPWTLKGNTWYNDQSKQPIISKINIYTGRKRKVEVLPYGHSRVLATKEGRVNFMVWRDNEDYSYSAYRNGDSEEWIKLDSAFELAQSLFPIGLSEDDKYVYLSGRVGEEEIYTLFSLNLETGEHNRIFESHNTDVEDYILDHNGMPAVGITYPGKSEYVYATSKSRTKKVHKLLVDAFKGQTVDIPSRTEDGKTLMVHVRSDTNPGEYYLFDRDNLSAKFLWANLSWIDPNHLRPMQPFALTTEDNIELHGYLTLPESKEGNDKPPMVVMIHGGPHQPGTRDFWEYNFETQLLANRGYAVLQVNFRGSDGYGRQFIRKGYRQWGGLMIDDINAAAQWAIDQGHVDGNKVCAYGASYGGYAALMSAVKANDLYKCTIGYVGIYDLNYMFTDSDIPTNWGGKAYLQRVLGDDKTQLNDYSPINHIDKIKAKVMLIHGAKDERVSEINSEALSEKLIAAGKAPVYLRYSQSGHGVYDEESRIELYQGLIDFLDTSLQ